MAKSLNKKRMRDSRLAVYGLLIAYIFSHGLLDDGATLHVPLKYLGYVLVLICAFGRIWCTAFLGGNKNVTLITQGPFSMTRNPLYVFSLIGFFGVGLMSTRGTILIGLVGLHIVNYHFLVRREEARLLTVFGDAYRNYCARVPRFLPRFAHYESPAQIDLRTSLLAIAMRDALVWFLPYPLFELIHYLHSIQWLPDLFLMP